MRNRGMTLIEMVVTLAILTMILSMCYAILFSTLDTKDRLEKMVEPSKISQAVLRLIAKDLEACYIYNQTSPFIGIDKNDEDRLEFTIYKPAGTGISSTIQKIRYVLEPTKNNSGEFILFRGVSFNSGSGEEKFSYQEIYDHVVALNFEYWKQGKWVKGWNPKTMGPAPKAVQIQLKIRGSEPDPEKNPEDRINTYTTIIGIPASM